jgi:PhnB protein
MLKLNIGLTFPGTCEEAFNLYRSVFGVEFESFVRYSEDSATDATTHDEEKNKIAFVALRIGPDLLCGDDTLESSGINVISGNNVSISVHPETRAEARRIFNELSAGGSEILPIADFPWGYCGILLDKFGVKWIVWHNSPMI